MGLYNKRFDAFYEWVRPDENITHVVILSKKIDTQRGLVCDIFDYPHIEVYKDVPITDLVFIGNLDMLQSGNIEKILSSIDEYKEMHNEESCKEKQQCAERCPQACKKKGCSRHCSVKKKK